jgi:hypothetical protein
MITYSTYDGGTLHTRRVGPRFEFELRNPKGETTATVEMSEADAWSLLQELGRELHA